MTVHLDRVREPGAGAKLIALHGACGYGRLLAPYCRLPSLAGLELVVPDLPGAGLTGSGRKCITYDTWVACVLDLIAEETRTDDRPVVLLGVSVTGRLAYDVAARAGSQVVGVITTSLLDPRRSDIRRRIAVRPELGRMAGLLGLVPPPVRPVRVPLRWLANIAAMSNHEQFAGLVFSDHLAGARWIPLSFVRSYLSSAPAVAPEDFRGPPVLLAHPKEDRWTPPSLSRGFFDRLAAPKRFALLSGAGHLPVEEAGLADLDRTLRDFLDELGVG